MKTGVFSAYESLYGKTMIATQDKNALKWIIGIINQNHDDI